MPLPLPPISKTQPLSCGDEAKGLCVAWVPPLHRTMTSGQVIAEKRTPVVTDRIHELISGSHVTTVWGRRPTMRDVSRPHRERRCCLACRGIRRYSPAVPVREADRRRRPRWVKVSTHYWSVTTTHGVAAAGSPRHGVGFSLELGQGRAPGGVEIGAGREPVGQL